ncbi:PPK2 family polyphosphate:nucleotide phosphotransferase [Streptomyces sp. SAI-135]|uniref:PPK2 family polyphosphate kinase n=1 Tax=unclassified Streptomyces TaxID=2593676 RepID=UPI0024730F47|nr:MULTISPECIES: PPK2 family polyphosphate kinase [unclassified Streptomyces]MDH6515833.1 PPK2 family polyphosphate:nucleotide phosphotransferase [Streptomyces sp. SAI-090]MDH6620083.1 PPK2 family polyphosphate:nucleotide phosphotransferase [Streptomyces sp. SAI-135]
MSKKGSKTRAAKKTGGDLCLRELLRVPGGRPVDLAAHDARETPAGPRDKQAGLAALTELAAPLADLQERLWAASTAGDRRRVLLVLQGMDTSGKGGTVKHVIGLFNPSGCRVRAFKAPTPKEQGHPFLWRIKKALPHAGELGIFDRSHYEDVLVARVRSLAPPAEIERRYDAIKRFEKSLADDGVTVVKCFLHISYGEQRDRLLKRLDRPDKRWKFDVADIDDRALWPVYQQAYETALERCSTPHAPWYLIPADRKWYRNWAVSRLLLEHLSELDPRYPEADFDVAQARRRLLEQ